MLKYIIAFIILIHGLIHFMGFAKAFGYGNITRLGEVSKPMSSLWLLVAFLFITVTILLLFKKDAWIIMGMIAAILSQLLIISAWKDAKFGTVANIMLVVFAILSIKKLL
jgi:hypothetical protein